jgi:hypothetical protein
MLIDGAVGEVADALLQAGADVLQRDSEEQSQFWCPTSVFPS